MMSKVACNALGGCRIQPRMRFMLIACAATWVSGGSTAVATELADLVARNTVARGGAAAIESVMVYEADIHIAEPSFEVDGRYVATRDGRMRIDIVADGQVVFTEALGRGGGWSWDPEQGVRQASEKGRAALRHGIEFPFKLFGLHEMAKRGHRLAVAGQERIGEVDYQVLALTLDDGFETRYYLHPATGLIERERQFRALHVDVDPTPVWIETEYADWRAVDGILFPHRMTERALASGELLSTGTIRAIRLNTSPAAERFEAP